MNLIAMGLCWWEINNGKCRLILMNHQTKFNDYVRCFICSFVRCMMEEQELP